MYIQTTPALHHLQQVLLERKLGVFCGRTAYKKPLCKFKRSYPLYLNRVSDRNCPSRRSVSSKTGTGKSCRCLGSGAGGPRLRIRKQTTDI